ncbi:hypothetical protein DEO72_LG10g879 [Vigna unguiculata]|uniref:Uncharacterized protein n=1 Tax=Vigna unguiculata TaxID=3917 RepID=A0A4D6N8M6_VIGUN|nr:hypothetical protein DEO72_LG10g879 [Vigna unguiculata]
MCIRDSARSALIPHSLSLLQLSLIHIEMCIRDSASSVVSSRAAVLLDFSSNVLYEPISRYGKLGFHSFGVVLAVLE